MSVIRRGCLSERVKEEDQVGHVTQICLENGDYNKVSVRERVWHVACRKSNWSIPESIPVSDMTLPG